MRKLHARGYQRMFRLGRWRRLDFLANDARANPKLSQGLAFAASPLANWLFCGCECTQYEF